MRPKVKKFVESCYLLRIQRREFDPTTGKEKFPPFEQYFTPDEFKRFQENPDGHAILEILYDPNSKAETPDDDAPKAPRRKS